MSFPSKNYRMPAVRVFGNENTRHVVNRTDDTEVEQLQRRVAGAVERATPQQLDAQPVRVVELPRPRDPQLRLSLPLSLAVAGSLNVSVKANTVLYADSTNGTDRVNLQYQDTQGDNSQPPRIMVPGRLRRERYFTNLVISWQAIAGANAVLEIYDDPDGALYIQD